MMKSYVTSCMNCAHTKMQSYGKLKQLPIPVKPWNSISMDFIEHLPASDGFTSILVVVYCLTKQSLFIPTDDTINSPQLTQLFLTHIFSKHRVPSHITSDQGTKFISHFFHSLSKLLQMELHFTSGYHPEGDGQMERINQVLEQYLRAYTNYQPDDWATLLPLAEFAYNNAPSKTTGVSPFFANKCYHPNLSMDTTMLVPSTEAQQFMAHLDEIHNELKQNIVDAQECYQKGADQHHLLAPPFKVGDKVFVKARIFKTTQPSKKLSEKNLGPYKIIGAPSSHSFTLRLPSQFWVVHPIFPVSQLKLPVLTPFPTQTQPPPPLLDIVGEPHYS